MPLLKNQCSAANLDDPIPDCSEDTLHKKTFWSVTRTSILKVLDFMFGGLHWWSVYLSCLWVWVVQKSGDAFIEKWGFSSKSGLQKIRLQVKDHKNHPELSPEHTSWRFLTSFFDGSLLVCLNVPFSVVWEVHISFFGMPVFWCSAPPHHSAGWLKTRWTQDDIKQKAWLVHLQSFMSIRDSEVSGYKCKATDSIVPWWVYTFTFMCEFCLEKICKGRRCKYRLCCSFIGLWIHVKAHENQVPAFLWCMVLKKANLASSLAILEVAANSVQSIRKRRNWRAATLVATQMVVCDQRLFKSTSSSKCLEGGTVKGGGTPRFLAKH